MALNQEASTMKQTYYVLESNVSSLEEIIETQNEKSVNFGVLL